MIGSLQFYKAFRYIYIDWILSVTLEDFKWRRKFPL